MTNWEQSSWMDEIVLDELLAAFAEMQLEGGLRSDPFGAIPVPLDLPSWLEFWERPAIRLRLRRLVERLASAEDGTWSSATGVEESHTRMSSVVEHVRANRNGNGAVEPQLGSARVLDECSPLDVPVVWIEPGSTPAPFFLPIGSCLVTEAGVSASPRVAEDPRLTDAKGRLRP